MRRVLVADDEAHVRRLLCKVLAQNGYEVEEASNGQHALEILRAESAFDLLVLDLMMPVMGGLEALATVRLEMPELPVLMMNGGHFYTNPPPDVACLCKPFSLRTLLEQVTTLIHWK